MNLGKGHKPRSASNVQFRVRVSIFSEIYAFAMCIPKRLLERRPLRGAQFCLRPLVQM